MAKKEISDIKDYEYFVGKKSKANTKMVAYLDELLRNKFFKKKLKLLKKERVKDDKLFSDKLDKANSISDRFEKLKREALTNSNSKYSSLLESLISEYGISSGAIELATAMMDEDYDFVQRQMHDVHLCSINDDYQIYVSPLNPAEDFIAHNLRQKRNILAYPISIGISPKATKVDVTDFIEKNWWWIQNGLNDFGLKPLRIRKRKNNKEVINFIWEKRNLSLKKIKELLDTEHPKNKLIYNEIQDIITYEKGKRLKKLT
ncbi:MAG: hypothetical protein KBC50_00040 [Candidatus Pacebacteria bacterium]|nr:hypothetical protein [Candidatus Paceibacterota bacterium]